MSKSTKAPADNGQQIEINDIGPIAHLSIPAPPGAIVVLDGPNGAGKSTALEAVEKLTTGRGSLTSRDGTVGGHVSGFGSTIRVVRGGANRKAGDVEVTNVEDDFRLADLIDPGLKDPIAADRVRIKVLVGLSGATADAGLFAYLAKGSEHFASIVSPESLTETDLVDMAARIKRDFEAASRARAKEAENLRITAAGYRKASEGIDLAAPCDPAALQAALEDCLTTHMELVRSRSSGLRLQEQAAEARVKYDQAKTSYSGPSVETATEVVTCAQAAQQAAYDNVQEIHRQLDDAKRELERARTDHIHAGEQLAAANHHSELLSGWLQTITIGQQEEVPDEEAITAAAERLQTARQAVEQAALVREALKREVEARASEAGAKDAELDADFLRESARATADVLTDLVAGMGGPFKVIATGDGQTRLTVRHPIRGETLFEELSDGERAKVAIDVVLNRFDSGIMALPQSLFERLDAHNRNDIARHLAGTKLTIVTAEADRDPNATELRWHVYEPAEVTA